MPKESRRSRDRKFWLRTGALAAGAFLLLTGVPYGIALYFFPLEYSDLKNRWELNRAGAEHRALNGWEAWDQNHCARERAVANCQCVALVHGLGDSAMTWKRQLMEKRESWVQPTRLVAVNLPGSGRTPLPENPLKLRVRTLALDLAEALRQVEGCTRWVVVGNSFGGWVASWTAIQAPGRVDRLLLVSAGGLSAGTSPSRQLLREGSVEALKEFQRRAYYRPRPLPEHVWEAAARRLREGGAGDLMSRQVEDDALESNAASIRVPTLVLWGEADQVTPIETGQTLAKLIPGAKFQSIPECGHLPQKECPAVVQGAINQLLGQEGSR